MGERILNTIEYMDRLVEAGVPEKQAKAQILILHELMGSTLATKMDIAEIKREIAEVKKDIAQLREDTKKDIAQLREDTKKDIAQLREDTKKDIETMGYRMTIWLGGIVAASAMFILGAIFTMGRMGLLQAIPN